MLFRPIFSLLLFAFTLVNFNAYAILSNNTITVPENLAQWQGWVQYKQEFRECPSLEATYSGTQSNHICAWPSELQLNVSETAAEFSQVWQVLDESRIPLPGDITYWPQSVTVNQQPVSVLASNNQPYILLSKGDHQIKGKISWEKRPESLRIPEQIALLRVSINNQPQAFNLLDKGYLWLGSVAKGETLEKDYLKLWVNRLISDGHPMQMTVALNMDVAGRAREQKLTQFSIDKYQLMQIQSQLNTRIDSQGFLWVQLKPGDHQIQLTFKIHGYPQQLEFEQTGQDWPSQEIWVYQDAPPLRTTQIENIAAIDAEQGFMNEWQHLPHYVINYQESMTINERHRGISHNFDGLGLQRQMWLSFDNQAFYFFDKIIGQKSKDWRVSTLDNYQLNQLSNHGKERLITYDENNRTGAEIRTPLIDIKASGEVAFDNMFHASGWDIIFNNTQIDLNIPPGRKLLYIGGADNTYGDWISQWQLIDLFFILVITALVFKVFGLLTSFIALFTLALGYHEPDMPTFLWFNLVVAMSLALKIKSEKLIKVVKAYQIISIGLLAILLLPFLADQIRFTLYPQLEKNRSLTDDFYRERKLMRAQNNYPNEDQLQMESTMLSPPPPQKHRERQELSEKVIITGSRIQRSDLDASYEQDAVIQAGKGKPDWQWQSASYSWNGPVAGDEKVNLVLLPEIGVKLFRITLILFSVLWLLFLFKSNDFFHPSSFKKWFKKFSLKSSTTHILSLSLISLTLLAFTAPPAFADNYPNEKLLQQLQQRIYPKIDCEPECVSLSQAELTVNGLKLELKMTFQSGTNKAGLLPYSEDWFINQVFINQKPVNHLWKNNQGSWIALPQGLSNVTLLASLKDKSDLTIAFNEAPRRFLHQVSGWQVSGVNMQQLTGNSLQLTRLVKPQALTDNSSGENRETTNAQEQSINNLFFVRRHFSFGSQWSLNTKVQRLAPESGTINTQINLLAFEQVLTESENIVDGKMQVVIPANENYFDWQSSISGSNQFELTALDNNSLAESWEILVYPNWHIQIEGIPAVLPEQQQPDDYWIYQYFPRANEKLHFSINKPPAVKGESVAITSLNQSYRLSKRKTTTDIQLNYKATRSEQLTLNIGESELKNISHDGKNISLGKVEGLVTINLNPGQHSLNIQLETIQEIGLKLDLIGAGLDKEFSNLTSLVELPESRWLIAASGPGYGPAIIYWGELIFFALLAIGLSQLQFSPLNYWQWLLLGLGMSTFSWPAMALVAAWLLGSEWRRQNPTNLQSSPLLKSWLILLSTLLAVIALVTAVPAGLLQTPDMGVIGNGSYRNSLNWFLDHGDKDLGIVSIISLPIWLYKGLMLLWATWLSFSLIRWLGWTTKDLSQAQFFRKNRSANKKNKLSKAENNENKNADNANPQDQSVD